MNEGMLSVSFNKLLKVNTFIFESGIELGQQFQNLLSSSEKLLSWLL